MVLGDTTEFWRGKVWVIEESEVYSSVDGTSWTYESYVPHGRNLNDRYYHATAVHEDKLWVMSGGDLFGNDLRNDVWYTEDGRRWTSATLAAPWAPRYKAYAVSFDGYLYIHGGQKTDPTMFQDSWRSRDGTSWTQWGVEWGGGPALILEPQALLVLNGRWWEFWSTHIYSWGPNLSDLVVVEAPWDQYVPGPYGRPQSSGPYGFTVTVCNGRFYMTGGEVWTYDMLGYRTYLTPRYSEVYSSRDGINWTLETARAPWPGRSYHSSIAIGDRLFIFGGGGGSSTVTPQYLNDIWYSEPAAAAKNWQRY